MVSEPPRSPSRVLYMFLASALLRADRRVDPNGLLSTLTPPPVVSSPAPRQPLELVSELP